MTTQRQHEMRPVSLIHGAQIIERILRHVGMWVARHTTTAESRGMSRNCSVASAKSANVPHCREAYICMHRGTTLKVRNDRFAVDLLGVLPRHYKSEFLSIH
jgi:hypothetical protein